MLLFLLPPIPLVAQDELPPDMAAMMGEMGMGGQMMEPADLDSYVAGMTATEGLFTYYTDEATKRVLICLKPEQLDAPFFISQTLNRGTGDFVFTAPMMWDTWVVEFRRDRDSVEFVVPNYQYSTVMGEPMARAFESGFSDTVIGRSYIEAESQADGRLAFDLSLLLASTNPVQTYSYWYGGFTIDWEGSYVSAIHGYPLNDEIDTRILLATGMSPGMQEINLHFSLSTPPEEGYVPRIADDRMGYFMDQSMVYSVETDRQDDRYRRYVERWRLEKADPTAEMSEPVKPIVFWLENTIPYEYRDAVREGILGWNAAYEQIGFKNAIVVKQMPDDADWDPADIRYSTIRWFVSPWSSYAIGPSRADPRTGELYDADIGVSADMISYAYLNWQMEADSLRDLMSLITPPGWPNIENKQINWDDTTREAVQSRILGGGTPWSNDYFAAIHAYEGGRTAAVLYARGMEPGSPEEQEFIRQYIVSLVMHEVGHTLGLRHNFAGSAATPFYKLHQAYWTRQHGLSQSIMDYQGSNVAPYGEPQGEYFQTTLGDFDKWVIAYGYSDFNGLPPEEEQQRLDEIASRASEPHNRYATDEDAYMYTLSMDPDAAVWEMGDDLVRYYTERLTVSQELMDRILDHWSEPGTRPPKLRRAFMYAFYDKMMAAGMVPTLIGGVRAYRDHIGDPNAHPSMVPVSAEDQRRALNFLITKTWNSDQYQFSPELLNMLASDTFPGLDYFSFFTARDIDLHGYVLDTQTLPFYWIYDSYVLQRVLNNEVRMPEGEEAFTLVELFDTVRNGIWSEVFNGAPIDSYRRSLQRAHLEFITEMILNPAYGTPEDAITLARRDLVTLKSGIEAYLGSNPGGDAMTIAHLQECLSRISLTLTAPMDRGGNEAGYMILY
jgi:hypothetical protein